MRSIDKFKIPDRGRSQSRSFSVYGAGALSQDERSDALATATRIREKERENAASQSRKSKVDELIEKAKDAKIKQAQNRPPVNEAKPDDKTIIKIKKDVQNETRIPTDDEFKKQLINADVANKSAKAKNLGTDATPEEIMNAALKDLF